MDGVLETISFELRMRPRSASSITEEYVKAGLSELVKDEDLSQFIL